MKRKSKQEKELAKTYDARFGIDAPLAATPVGGIPPPPDFLPPDAAEIWRVKAKLLHERGALAEIDLVDLAAYCRDIALYHRAMSNAASEGEVTDFEQGSQKIKVINNWLKVADQAFSRAIKIGDRFGFSPKSRSNITAMSKDQENDKSVFSNYSDYVTMSAFSAEGLSFEPESESDFIEALVSGWEPRPGDLKRARSRGWHIPKTREIADIKEQRAKVSTANHAREMLSRDSLNDFELGLVEGALWAFDSNERPAIEARLRELQSRPQ